jgi:hypothetical protein
MKFVDNFIKAISEGIAIDKLSESELGGALQNPGSAYIKKRINNLEALRPNPYKPYFQNIIQNILVRGGIVAYLTRSPDPNFPGDYDTFFKVDRGTSSNDIIALVDAEMENIDDNLLGSLQENELNKLERFCAFWENMLTEDALSLKSPNKQGELRGEIFLDNSSKYLSEKNKELPNELLDFKVLIEKPANWDGTFSNQTGLISTTLRDEIPSWFTKKPTSKTDSIDTTNSNFIDTTFFQARKVVNNGLCYFKPLDYRSDSYIYVAIQSPDSNKTEQIASSPSDSDIKNDKEKQKLKPEPLGYVNVTNPQGTNGKLLPVIDSMNSLTGIDSSGKKISDGLLLDYSRLLNPNNDFYNTRSVTQSGYTYFTVKNRYCSPDDLQKDQIPAKNISFSVIHHPGTDNDLVFGPFVKTPEAVVHRAWIKRICGKLKTSIESVKQKKEQFISDVLGKSADQRDLLYKQMHVLYHQWEVLILEDSNESGGSINDSKGSIADEMSKRYGNHINYDMAS